MRELFAGILMFAISPALAGQISIAEKAAGCWALPGGLETPPMAEFNVVLDNEGNVLDAKVTKYRPHGERGKEFVLTAVRALQLCQPYPGAAKNSRVVMDPSAFSDRPTIDPFKP